MHPAHPATPLPLVHEVQAPLPVLPQRAVSTRGYDLFLIVALTGATVPLGQMLAAPPWGAHLPVISLPAALAGGLLCGMLGLAAHSAADSFAARLTPRGFPMAGGAAVPAGMSDQLSTYAQMTPEPHHRRGSMPVLVMLLAPFGLAPFLVGGATLGCVILATAAHVTLAIPAGIDPGLILLGALAGFLGALMPYILLVHSGWMLAGLFAVVAVVSWHGAVLSREQHIWLIVLLLLAGTLVATERLRRLARWRAVITQSVGAQGGRQRTGHSARQSQRTGLPVGSALVVLTLTLLSTLLASVIQASIPPLQNLWRESPLLRHGPLTSSAVQTTPTVQLGADLTLDAVPLQGDASILSYSIEQPSEAALTPPPLLGTTLDSYADGRWTQGHDVVAPWPGFSPPANATQLVAQVTLHQVLRAGDQTVLPGLSMAVEYSVSGAQPRLLATPPTDLTGIGDNNANNTGVSSLQACLLTTDWVTAQAHAIPPGMTYSVRALSIDQDAAAAAPDDLPSDPNVYGWDTATYARMTALPPALASTLRDDAHAWSIPSGASGASGASSPQSISLGAVARAQALSDFFRQHMILDPSYRPATTAGDATIADFLVTRRGNAATYVTTYILLLRALGYPTRIAEGFAPPSFYDGLQVVRASDFLYWAQIALPGVGWFDSVPTGERVPISLGGSRTGTGQAHSPTQSPTPPTPTAATSNPTPPPPPPSSGIAPFDLLHQLTTPPTLVIAGAAVALILLALLLLLVILAFGNLLWVRRSTGQARYRDVVRVLRASLRLAALANLSQIPPGATPEEAAQLVAKGLELIAQRSAVMSKTSSPPSSPQAASRTLSPRTTQAIRAILQLTEVYQQGRFGASAGHVDALSSLAQNDLADFALALRLALYPRLLRILWATAFRRAPRDGRSPAWRGTIAPLNG